jgi:hypothetical protein
LYVLFLFCLVCSSGVHGGVIYMDNTRITLSFCEFVNTSNFQGEGGVIYMIGNEDGFLNASSCKFFNISSIKEGAGVCCLSNRDGVAELLLFERCNFTNCSAIQYGGIMRINAPKNANITQCLFDNCTSEQCGMGNINCVYFILLSYLFDFCVIYLFFFFDRTYLCCWHEYEI